MASIQLRTNRQNFGGISRNFCPRMWSCRRSATSLRWASRASARRPRSGVRTATSKLRSTWSSRRVQVMIKEGTDFKSGLASSNVCCQILLKSSKYSMFSGTSVEFHCEFHCKFWDVLWFRQDILKNSSNINRCYRKFNNSCVTCVIHCESNAIIFMLWASSFAKVYTSTSCMFWKLLQDVFFCKNRLR